MRDENDIEVEQDEDREVGKDEKRTTQKIKYEGGVVKVEADGEVEGGDVKVEQQADREVTDDHAIEAEEEAEI